jgi:hypothetical protein
MSDDQRPAQTDDQTVNGNPGMPRWVKIFLIAAAAVLVLLVVAMLIGGGEHGPGRHLSSASAVATAGLGIDR